mmetsp:Transcript_68052/g.118406  ORF Transcript_68052/g.118406 Transcript_68052/m.118406 type:complete len:114 (-) Transcript_68052:1033-1374(-)
MECEPPGIANYVPFLLICCEYVGTVSSKDGTKHGVVPLDRDHQCRVLLVVPFVHAGLSFQDRCNATQDCSLLWVLYQIDDQYGKQRPPTFIFNIYISLMGDELLGTVHIIACQ